MPNVHRKYHETCSTIFYALKTMKRFNVACSYCVWLEAPSSYQGWWYTTHCVALYCTQFLSCHVMSYHPRPTVCWYSRGSGYISIAVMIVSALFMVYQIEWTNWCKAIWIVRFDTTSPYDVKKTQCVVPTIWSYVRTAHGSSTYACRLKMSGKCRNQNMECNEGIHGVLANIIKLKKAEL